MCRWSASTSHASGVCPSAPCAHLNSKRHVATAFAAAHARKAPHRIRHACSNLFCRRKGCSRALDLASWATKDCNSGDHLPPTSIAKTTRRARLPLPTSSGCLRSLRLLARLEHHSVRVSCSCVRRTIAMQGTDQSRVQGQLGPTENGQPATTSNLRLSATTGRGKSRSRTRTLVVTRAPASRHTRAAAFSSAKPRRPNAPVLVHDARWWPNESIGRPHRHKHRENGNGRRRRRSRMVLKRCGGIFVISVVGGTVNANPALGPPCDRRIARSLDPIRSKRTSCLKWRSTLDAASCCHPPRAMPGSISSGSSGLGRTSQRACQDGGSKPIMPTNDLAQAAAAPKNGVSGCPSNCATIAKATPRWRANTIGRQSAQLAQ